jgi:hypothetical protein
VELTKTRMRWSGVRIDTAGASIYAVWTTQARRVQPAVRVGVYVGGAVHESDSI